MGLPRMPRDISFDGTFRDPGYRNRRASKSIRAYREYRVLRKCLMTVNNRSRISTKLSLPLGHIKIIIIIMISRAG